MLGNRTTSNTLQLLAPAHKMIFPDGNVTLTWTDITGAKWHRLHLTGRQNTPILKHKFKDLSAICADGTCSVNLSTLNVTLAADQKYKWWVEARVGAAKVKTDKWKFQIDPNALPSFSQMIEAQPPSSDNENLRELRYLEFIEKFPTRSLKWWQADAVESYSGQPTASIGRIEWYPVSYQFAKTRMEANSNAQMSVQVTLDLGTDPTKLFKLQYISWAYGYRCDGNQYCRDDQHQLSLEVRNGSGTVIYTSPTCTFTVSNGYTGCSAAFANLNLPNARTVTVTYSTVGAVNTLGANSYYEMVLGDFIIQTTKIVDDQNLPTTTPSLTPTPCGSGGSVLGRNEVNPDSEVCQFITNTPRPTSVIFLTNTPPVTSTLSNEQLATIFPLPMIEPTGTPGIPLPVRLSDLEFVDRAWVRAMTATPNPAQTPIPLCSRDLNPVGIAAIQGLITSGKALVMVADPELSWDNNGGLGNFLAIRISISDLPIEIRTNLRDKVSNPTIKILIDNGFGYLFIGYGHLSSFSVQSPSSQNAYQALNPRDQVGLSGKTGLNPNNPQQTEHLDISVFYVSGEVQNNPPQGTNLPPNFPIVEAQYDPLPQVFGQKDDPDGKDGPQTPQPEYTYRSYFHFYKIDDSWYGLRELIDPIALWPIIADITPTTSDFVCP